ncbi:hypothetical protein ENUP19_0061G0084 [Entamoeba nuttalli]|uniref:Uncharacterized protein n=2 Tax=Entamoeba nuttalli TaxID=412467 RepID=K2H5S7_ENTNP|nr:hypothetical protein ENU1_184000 [Entamoeba nuttalli P19]EKE37844.1 hypothetical protein ENU1_184000 [Entamoeba nuttalli P19]|eukprot:XP_008859816.1 hypothetical protein ENU1_184000 [Entamoeba nuttalli P19]
MSKRISISSPFSGNNSPTYLRQSFFSVKSLSSHTLHEHWGVIWGSFETIIGQVTSKDLLSETSWKVPRRFNMKKGNEMSYVFLLDIISYPEMNSKQLIMEYVENTQVIQDFHSRVKNYGMNQYYKSIPLKTSIHIDRPTEIRIQTTHIPTYYYYEFGKRIKNGEEVDIIIFTLHIPFMVKSPTEYPVIIFNIGIDLPKDIINHKMFHDSLYDYINRIFYYYQLANFTLNNKDSSEYLIEELYVLIDKIDEFIHVFNNKQQFINISTHTKNTSKEYTRYLCSIISGYIQSYYTICIPFSTDTITDIRILLDPFALPAIQDFHSNKMTININPFFTLQFVTKFDPSQYFQFPFPICLIDSSQFIVQSMKDIDTISYYKSRSSYFLNIINKRLKVNTSVNPINPISFLAPIDHCFLIEDFIRQFVKLISQNQLNTAVYLLQQTSNFMIIRGMKLFYFIINSSFPFGKKLIEQIQNCLDLDKEDIQLLIQLFKFDQPYIVSKIQLSVNSILQQDSQITRNFF